VPLHYGVLVPLHYGVLVPLHYGVLVPLHYGVLVPLHYGVLALRVTPKGAARTFFDTLRHDLPLRLPPSAIPPAPLLRRAADAGYDQTKTSEEC